MQITNEDISSVAQAEAWSPEKAQGFLDGETARRRGAPPSLYATVGKDDYCLGFRAAFFERKSPAANRVGLPNAASRTPAKARVYPVAASTAASEYPHLAAV